MESSQQDRVPRAEYDPPWLDVSVAHPARTYDAWLGGKDNFVSDRIAAEAGLRAFPGAAASARSNRDFLVRVVSYLTAQARIRQFLDIGVGLPAADNVHQVAQAIAPECRVAYVDNDPAVLLHAQALLEGTGQGTTGYIDADLRDPGKILHDAARVLDLTQPVAVLLLGVLHFIQPDEGPHEIVRALMDAVPAGSYLAISHLTGDIYPEHMAAFHTAVGAHVSQPAVLRDHAEVSRFFDGLRRTPPGIVQISKWHPRNQAESDAPAALWGGLAHKG